MQIASAAQYTGTGTGSTVFEACLHHAAEHETKKIVPVTGKALKPAMHIYKKYGFQEIPRNIEE